MFTADWSTRGSDGMYFEFLHDKITIKHSKVDYSKDGKTATYKITVVAPGCCEYFIRGQMPADRAHNMTIENLYHLAFQEYKKMIGAI
jgi:hypothetical protein